MVIRPVLTNMTLTSRKALAVLQRLAVPVLLSLLGAGLITLLVVGWFIEATPPRTFVAFCVFVIWLAGIGVATAFYLIAKSNHRLKRCGTELHEINHIYRDALYTLFAADNQKKPLEPERLLLTERAILTYVCEKIAAMYWNLIGRKCVVTVKLLVEEEDGRRFCFTWARSSREIHRQETDQASEKFAVGTGENTGFDRAFEPGQSGPAYFYGANLPADKTYKNQRTGWKKLYRSTIVVPIQYCPVVSAQGKRDVLGFLCVDTRSTYLLNDTYHVQFLAAFADQMYNFLSIMRRRYVLAQTGGPVTGRQS